ncbi:MAG: hypothetical protein ABR575_05055 [Actinomycetota bacterium]
MSDQSDQTDQTKDQPEESAVDDYAPKYPEPEEATVVEPESRSGMKGAGTAEWECLTCGRTFTEDLGKCPDDGAPLRKTGPAAVAVAQSLQDSSEPIQSPASRAQDTPEGFSGAKPGSRGEEPGESVGSGGEAQSGQEPKEEMP